MPRRPQVRRQHDWADQFRTGSEPNLTTSHTVPHFIVRGLIRGIFQYLSVPARRRRIDDGHLDWYEDGLLELIGQKHGLSELIDQELRRFAQAVANERDDKKRNDEMLVKEQFLINREVSGLSEFICKGLMELSHHPHPFALSRESNWLRKQLEPYPMRKARKQRLAWLHENLPHLLRDVNRISSCPSIPCPRRTTVPEMIELQQWVDSTRGIGDLRIRILAHFHNSTHSTVRRALSSRTS